MKSGVVPPFKKGQPLNPALWSLMNHAMEIYFKSLVEPLNLAVGLEVVG